MNIKEAREELCRTILAYTCKDAGGDYKIPQEKQRPVLLIGPPGIGKTAIMEQAAKMCGVSLVAYTITHHTRQSAIGLPIIREKEYGGTSYSVTEYTMSEIIASVYECMERTGKKEGILFIDEINCVSETLAPAMLQFLQCKTFGSHRVPEGWVIAAAGNPSGYNKSVRDFDIVTLDRVRLLSVEENLSVWREFAREAEVHEAILTYLELKPQNFYRMEAYEGGTYFATARGWEDLSRMLYVYEELGFPVEASFVGEFIQYPLIAGDFARFYAFFTAYKERFPVIEILEGKADEQMKPVSREELLSGMHLMLDVLSEHCRQWQNNGKTESDEELSKEWKHAFLFLKRVCQEPVELQLFLQEAQEISHVLSYLRQTEQEDFVCLIQYFQNQNQAEEMADAEARTAALLLGS